MPVSVRQSDSVTQELANSEAVPAWLVARREHSLAVNAPAEPNAETANGDAKPSPPPIPSHQMIDLVPVLPAKSDAGENVPPRQNWFSPQFSKQGMIGIAVSLVFHAIVVLILACLLVSQVTLRDSMSIFGVTGNTDEAGTELILDSELLLDAGESAPIQMADLSQALESTGPKSDLAESMRVGLGGKGTGDAKEGQGTSMSIAGLKIPGHAQTKGSFSAWTDPRDPKPGEDYFVVILIRLPGNVTKLRGSDVTGNVIGTDSYRQAIRFKSTDLLPIKNGVVEIRIAVPGAARLVRDTIRVESKILREKQIFEIEF